MNKAFYNSYLGAYAQQTKLNVIGNNIANINTAGYKPLAMTFSDLLYQNITASPGNTTIMDGGGIRAEKTDIIFNNSGYSETGSPYDFAIAGDGFFAVLGTGQTAVPAGEILYTRQGAFFASENIDGNFYLMSHGGYVLDNNYRPIVINPDDPEMPGESRPAVFVFNNTEAMRLIGDNYYIPDARNGNPTYDPEATAIQGALEVSGVDFAVEVTAMIETQRAYQMALRMLQTSDEVMQTVNALR